MQNARYFIGYSTLAALLSPWFQELLLSTPSFEALSLNANSVPCPPVPSRLQKLQHLEQTLDWEQMWLRDLLADLSSCMSLRSLVISVLQPASEAQLCSCRLCAYAMWAP